MALVARAKAQGIPARFVANIRHHKGRCQPGMCINEEFGAMAEVQESIGRSAKTVCGSCPDRGRCPWFKQSSDTGPGVIVMAHANLCWDDPRIQAAEVVVVDESIASSMFSQAKIAIDDLSTDLASIRKRRPRGQATISEVKRYESAELYACRHNLIHALKGSVHLSPATARAPSLTFSSLKSIERWSTFEAGQRVQKTASRLDYGKWLEDELQASLAKAIATASDLLQRTSDAAARSRHKHDINISVAKFQASLQVMRIYEAIETSLCRDYVFGIRVYWTRERNGSRWINRHWVWCAEVKAIPASLLAKGAIWLDGTANEEVLRALVATPGAQPQLKVIDYDIAPGHVTAYQYVDKTFSRSMLDGSNIDFDAVAELEDVAAQKSAEAASPPAWMLATAYTLEDVTTHAASAVAAAECARGVAERRKKRTDANISRLHRFVLDKAFQYWREYRAAVQRADGSEMKHAVLLVAQKSVIAALKQLHLPPNVKTAHFGALRGLNNFKDVPVAIVAGRPALSNDALEVAEALHMHDANIQAIQPATGWPTAPVTIETVSGPVQIQSEQHLRFPLPRASCSHNDGRSPTGRGAHSAVR